MKRTLGLSLSIGIALAGLSAIIFGLSRITVMAEQLSMPEAAIVVNTLDDDELVDGDCSLREAITAANEDTAVDACPAGDAVITDTITFDVAGTITVTSRLWITASGALVMDGARAITISGTGLQIYSGADLVLKELTVWRNGDMWGAGGISNSGTLTLINCNISGNTSGLGAGGISNDGTLSIIDSTLSDNHSGQGPGGIYNFGKMTVKNSTLSGNGGGAVGAISSGGTLTMSRILRP